MPHFARVQSWLILTCPSHSQSPIGQLSGSLQAHSKTKFCFDSLIVWIFFITCVELPRADWANIGILLYTLPGPSISGVHQEEVPLSALYQTPIHILTQGVVAKETLQKYLVFWLLPNFLTWWQSSLIQSWCWSPHSQSPRGFLVWLQKFTGGGGGTVE